MLRRFLSKVPTQLFTKSFSSDFKPKTTSLIQQAFDSEKTNHAKHERQKDIENHLIRECDQAKTALQQKQEQLRRVQSEMFYQNHQALMHQKWHKSLKSYLDIFLRALHYSIITGSEIVSSEIAKWPDDTNTPNFEVLEFYQSIFAAHGIKIELDHKLERDFGTTICGLTTTFPAVIKSLTSAEYAQYKILNLPELEVWLTDFNDQLEKTVTRGINEVQRSLAQLNKVLHEAFIDDQLPESGMKIKYQGCKAAVELFIKENSAYEILYHEKTGLISVKNRPAVQFKP